MGEDSFDSLCVGGACGYRGSATYELVYRMKGYYDVEVEKFSWGLRCKPGCGRNFVVDGQLFFCRPASRRFREIWIRSHKSEEHFKRINRTIGIVIVVFVAFLIMSIVLNHF